ALEFVQAGKTYSSTAGKETPREKWSKWIKLPDMVSSARLSAEADLSGAEQKAQLAIPLIPIDLKTTNRIETTWHSQDVDQRKAPFEETSNFKGTAGWAFGKTVAAQFSVSDGGVIYVQLYRLSE